MHFEVVHTSACRAGSFEHVAGTLLDVAPSPRQQKPWCRKTFGAVIPYEARGDRKTFGAVPSLPIKRAGHFNLPFHQ